MTYEGKEALKTVRLWMMDESTKVQQFDEVEGKLLEKINTLKGAAVINQPTKSAFLCILIVYY